MNGILQHDALLTIREVVTQLNLTLVEADLVLPVKDEGCSSRAAPLSITKKTGGGNIG